MVRRTFNASFISYYQNMILAIKERHFAIRIIRRLLKSHSAVSAKKLGLSGKAFYREVLLHTQKVDPSRVDQILRQASNSIDEWTAPGRDELRFREVVHFFVLSQHIAAGNDGTVVSFGNIVNSKIPANL